MSTNKGAFDVDWQIGDRVRHCYGYNGEVTATKRDPSDLLIEIGVLLDGKVSELPYDSADANRFLTLDSSGTCPITVSNPGSVITDDAITEAVRKMYEVRNRKTPVTPRTTTCRACRRYADCGRSCWWCGNAVPSEVSP